MPQEFFNQAHAADGRFAVSEDLHRPVGVAAVPTAIQAGREGRHADAAAHWTDARDRKQNDQYTSMQRQSHIASANKGAAAATAAKTPEEASMLHGQAARQYALAAKLHEPNSEGYTLYRTKANEHKDLMSKPTTGAFSVPTEEVVELFNKNHGAGGRFAGAGAGAGGGGGGASSSKGAKESIASIIARTPVMSAARQQEISARRERELKQQTADNAVRKATNGQIGKGKSIEDILSRGIAKYEAERAAKAAKAGM